MSHTTLLTIHSDGGELCLPLVPGTYVIGRDASCDVVVPSLYVAPRQARIQIAADHFVLENLADEEGSATPATRRFDIPNQVHFPHFTVSVGDTIPTVVLDTHSVAEPSHGTTIPGESAGDVIDAYTLGERLGEGGFGTVWRARQEKPVRRDVAVKVLKPGMDSREVLARFDQERQALARMNHPGIARVFDAGATAQGRPYFVMEWVQGLSLTRYARKHDLDLEARLRLFAQVCQAVNHAHQKGIIHRDLKPSNILVAEVDGKPVPKVIDFGIAKAVSGEKLTDYTVVTLQEQLMGTPAYMSPEQARHIPGDVDTRSDIYSLGAVLYELLTGTTPFLEQELMSSGAEEMFRLIRNEVPQRPSTRIRTRKRSGEVAPGSFQDSSVDTAFGDLDWIVMKCLEKEPERRYESAAALAEDVEAYLEHRPITARPPSLGYLAWRFTQRNKLAVGAAAAVLTAIVAGLAVSAVLYVRERDARKLADVEAEKSRQVARFLKDALGAVGPSVALGRDTTLMRDVLDQAIARMDAELSDRPRVSAELRQVIGRTFSELREFGPALEQLEKALSQQRALHPAGHPDLAGCIMDYASALEMAGRVKESEPVAREGLAMWQRVEGPESIEAARAKTLIAWIRLKSGRAAEGESMAKEAFDVWLRHPRDVRLEEAPKTYATISQHLGRGDEAAACFAQELKVLKETYGAEHPAIANCLDNYGVQLVRMKRDVEAEPILQEALSMGRKFHGDRSPHEDHVLAGLAQIAGRRGDVDQQLDYVRQGRAVGLRVYPPGHRYWRESQGNYLKTVLSVTADCLDGALNASETHLSRQAQAEKAAGLLAEMSAARDLESLMKPEQAWIDCLAEGITVAQSILDSRKDPEALERFMASCETVSRSAKDSSAWQVHKAKAARYVNAIRKLMASGSAGATEASESALVTNPSK